MNIITDDEILKDLQSKLEKMVVDKTQIEQQIERAKKAIEFYSIGQITFSKGNISENNVASMIEYDANVGWQEKIILVLKSSNCAMTTRQIIDFIKAKEPMLDEQKTYRDVSGTVFNLSKMGQLKPYKPIKMKGHYYASPLWFDNEGKLLEQYKPKITEKDLW